MGTAVACSIAAALTPLAAATVSPPLNNLQQCPWLPGSACPWGASPPTWPTGTTGWCPAGCAGSGTYSVDPTSVVSLYDCPAFTAWSGPQASIFASTSPPNASMPFGMMLWALNYPELAAAGDAASFASILAATGGAYSPYSLNTQYRPCKARSNPLREAETSHWSLTFQPVSSSARSDIWTDPFRFLIGPAMLCPARAARVLLFHHPHSSNPHLTGDEPGRLPSLRGLRSPAHAAAAAAQPAPSVADSPTRLRIRLHETLRGDRLLAAARRRPPGPQQRERLVSPDRVVPIRRLGLPVPVVHALGAAAFVPPTTATSSAQTRPGG